MYSAGRPETVVTNGNKTVLVSRYSRRPKTVSQPANLASSKISMTLSIARQSKSVHCPAWWRRHRHPLLHVLSAFEQTVFETCMRVIPGSSSASASPERLRIDNRAASEPYTRGDGHNKGNCYEEHSFYTTTKAEHLSGRELTWELTFSRD